LFRRGKVEQGFTCSNVYKDGAYTVVESKRDERVSPQVFPEFLINVSELIG
jgi:hypothetical protein